MEQSTWITVKEAADISGYGQEYIRELIRDKKITGKKFGWQWMVDKTSIENYTQDQAALKNQR